MNMIKIKSTQQQNNANQTQQDSFDQDKLRKLPNSKNLFNHLFDKGVLTEKDARNLWKYKKLYLQSKADIGAPRLLQSQIGSIASKFGGQEPLTEDSNPSQDEQQLVNFRNLSYGLHKTHKDLTTFVERLFEDSRNDFNFYHSWVPSQQKRGALVLKEFANLIKL